MVPSESLRLEDSDDDDGEHRQRNGFLYDFQLNKVEWTSVLHGTDAVGGNHEGVLKEGHAPREDNDGDERPVFDDIHLLEFEIAVPCKGHEDIGAYKHEHGD